MVIEGMLRRSFSCDAVPWDNLDDRSTILMVQPFPDGCKLETDIYYIKESTTGLPLTQMKTPAENVHLKIKPYKRNIQKSLFCQYRGAVRFEGTWNLVEPIFIEGFMDFTIENVESFCVVSFIPGQTYNISTDGGDFISTVDDRIRVTFPPESVNEENQIKFKVHPVNFNCLIEKSEQDVDNDFFATSPSLSTNHVEFKKPVMVQLPLQYTSEKDIEDSYHYIVFKWEEDGSLELTDIEPLIKHKEASFEVSSFCGFGCVSVSRSTSQQSIINSLQESLELKKWCKILFFVGEKKDKNLQIMLECVDLKRVSEVSDDRKKYGFKIVPEWTSKDLFLKPNTGHITVDVKGNFVIPRDIASKRPELTFNPVIRENFTRFPVELDNSPGKAGYGVLSLKIGKTVLDEIYYDPGSTRKVPLNQKIKHKVVSPKAPVHNSTEAQCPKPETSNEKEFFTEKGILVLSKKMTIDDIFEVCIHMNMTKDQHDSIRKNSASNKQGNFSLLKTALNQQPCDQQVNSLVSALKASEQLELIELAGKVEDVWSKGRGLHTI
ncbi:Hypothetical predicted protein [Mytilus galloprovincialis]|uniref:ZU5 domain-containing protein n=1 Tax=Mytilus galloprovincialis TaxID=29158 RepID=A0A8B6F503_MYTGA|nr:Hypothetical predicted protein [Mytilus galloprovincialis]